MMRLLAAALAVLLAYLLGRASGRHSGRNDVRVVDFLWRCGGEARSLVIFRALEAYLPGIVDVHQSLDRLEGDGMIVTRQEPGGAERGGRPNRVALLPQALGLVERHTFIGEREGRCDVCGASQAAAVHGGMPALTRPPE